MLEEKTYHTGTVALNYAEGPAAGPPLVLIHGGGDRWQMFAPLLPALVAYWHVYALDLRGHGKSGRVPRSYRPEDYVADLLAFVESKLDAPAVFLGHSLGGWVALLAAAQLGDRVRALILGDPPLNIERFVAIESSAARVGMWKAMRDLASRELSVPELALALAELTGGEATALHDWAETLSYADGDAVMYHAEGRIEEYVQHVDVDGALRRLTCAVLLVQGDPASGAMVTDADAAHALSLLAYGAHVRLDGIGHNLGMDTQETMPLLRAVTAFLESLE
jgi:pimeloyl-ACP methyl ester carboxylesterase